LEPDVGADWISTYGIASAKNYSANTPKIAAAIKLKHDKNKNHVPKNPSCPKKKKGHEGQFSHHD
jgi:hypothetical protein